MITLRLTRFIVAGAVGFVVDAGVLYAALYWGAGWYTGRLISFLSAVVVTWLVNRKWTFGDGRTPPGVAEFVRYLSAMSLGGMANYLTYALVGLVFPRTALLPLFGVAAGSLVGLAVNYTTARVWVFRER